MATESSRKRKKQKDRDQKIKKNKNRIIDHSKKATDAKKAGVSRLFLMFAVVAAAFFVVFYNMQ